MTRKIMECERCGSEFLFKARKRFCGKKCFVEAKNAEYRKLNPRPLRSSATTGAMHEFLVCVDLLRRGYLVFRAVSPSCDFDLVATESGGKNMLRIEVTTGQRFEDGKIAHPPKRAENFDVLAVVTHDSVIKYIPNRFNEIRVAS